MNYTAYRVMQFYTAKWDTDEVFQTEEAAFEYIYNNPERYLKIQTICTRVPVCQTKKNGERQLEEFTNLQNEFPDDFVQDADGENIKCLKELAKKYNREPCHGKAWKVAFLVYGDDGLEIEIEHISV